MPSNEGNMHDLADRGERCRGPCWFVVLGTVGFTTAVTSCKFRFAFVCTSEFGVRFRFDPSC